MTILIDGAFWEWVLFGAVLSFSWGFGFGAGSDFIDWLERRSNERRRARRE